MSPRRRIRTPGRSLTEVDHDLSPGPALGDGLPLGQVRDLAEHFVMITFCFTFGHLAYYSRFVRQNLLEVIRQDYIRTARAKGVRERGVIVKHAVRNALLPVVTIIGLQVPNLIGGSLVIEVIFGIPGVALYLYRSLLEREFPAIIAVNMVIAVVIVVTNLVVDVMYAWLDPRIQFS